MCSTACKVTGLLYEYRFRKMYITLRKVGETFDAKLRDQMFNEWNEVAIAIDVARVWSSARCHDDNPI